MNTNKAEDSQSNTKIKRGYIVRNSGKLFQVREKNEKGELVAKNILTGDDMFVTLQPSHTEVVRKSLAKKARTLFKKKNRFEKKLEKIIAKEQRLFEEAASEFLEEVEAAATEKISSRKKTGSSRARA